MKIGIGFSFHPKEFYDVEKKICCIIKLHDGTVNPGVLFQAVLEPSKVSPDGKSYRFTQDEHCEVHGWKPIDKIEIVEILEEDDGT